MSKAFCLFIAAHWIELCYCNIILLDEVLWVNHWLLDGDWLRHECRCDIGDHMRLLCLMIHNFQAIPANPDPLIIGILGYFDKVLRTVLANCSPTFSAMMLTLKKAKCCLTDKAIRHLLTTPKRSLSNFNGLNPIFEARYFWIWICESSKTHLRYYSLWNTKFYRL